MTLAELRNDAVVLACAVSGGVHAGLVPAHLGEGRSLAVAFAATAAALGVLAVALTHRPGSPAATAAAAIVLAGLLAAYAAAASVGLPALTRPEGVDGLGLATKAVEAMGLLAASSLLRRRHGGIQPLRSKGSLT